MPTMQLPNNPIIRVNRNALPRDWSSIPGSEGLILQSDIAVSKASSLRAKVLLFKDLQSMHRFWKVGLSRPALPSNTLAVSNALTEHVFFYKVKGKPQRPPELQVDPRYFCALGFCLDHLKVDYIVHESVHAAFAYSRRVRGRHHWFDDDAEGEERICYPAGRIAEAIATTFHKKGFPR